MKKNNLIINSLGGCRIRVERVRGQAYLCLTDLAAYKKSRRPNTAIVQKWMRRKATTEFITQWERKNNPRFRETEVHPNHFSAVKWVKLAGAIGLITKLGGRDSGTWAHIDIASQFMGSLSVEFQLYTIEQLRRLEDREVGYNRLEPERAIWHGLTQFDRLQTGDLEKSQMKRGNTAQNLYYVLCMQSKRI